MSSCGPAERSTLGSGFIVRFLVLAWLLVPRTGCDRAKVATHRRLNTVLAGGRSLGAHRVAGLASNLLVAAVTHVWLLASLKADDVSADDAPHNQCRRTRGFHRFNAVTAGSGDKVP